MKYFTFIILFFLAANSLSSDKFSKDQKEYLSIHGGYYKNLVKQNDKLAQESIKRGIKVYGKKYRENDDSYQNYLTNKKQSDYNPDFAKYNSILDKYFYSQLDLSNQLTEKINLEQNLVKKSKLEIELEKINISYEILLKALNSNNLEYKKQICNLFNAKDQYEKLKKKTNLNAAEKKKLKGLEIKIKRLLEYGFKN